MCQTFGIIWECFRHPVFAQCRLSSDLKFPAYTVYVVYEEVSKSMLWSVYIVNRSQILLPSAFQSAKSSLTRNTTIPRRLGPIAVQVTSCCWNWHIRSNSTMLCLQSAFHHSSKSCQLEKDATQAAGEHYRVSVNSIIRTLFDFLKHYNKYR